MIELTALPGVPRADKARARSTRWAAVAAPPDRVPDSLHGEVQRLVGLGWVDELIVRGDSRPEVLNAVVEAARTCGRRARIVPSAPLTDLPLALNGERWLQDEDTEGTS